MPFAVLSARVDGPGERPYGSALPFVVEYSLPEDIQSLAFDLRVTDARGELAFRTTSDWLGIAPLPCRCGTHVACFVLSTALPAGAYRVALAFQTVVNGKLATLATIAPQISFTVVLQRSSVAEGYADLALAVDAQQLSDEYVGRVGDGHGSVSVASVPRQLAASETIALMVTLANESGSTWRSLPAYPVSLSYHWVDPASGREIEGGRAPLPEGRLAARESAAIALDVVAPAAPGRYELRIEPVQDHLHWFRDVGFVPVPIEVEVVEPGDARVLAPADPRIRSEVGMLEAGRLVSTSRAGYLLFTRPLPVAPGRWRVCLAGECRPDGDRFHLEVLEARSRCVIAQRLLEEACTGAGVDFDVEDDAASIEFRAWVGSRAVASLSSVQVLPGTEAQR
jgi:hypothetical protein